MSPETPTENEVTEEAAESGSTEISDERPDPLAEAEAKVAQLKEQLLRTAADFDNYRKRSRREIEDAAAAGRENMLKDLLPVFDNLERATAQADSVTDVASFVSGIQMVVRQFADTLKRGGIERIASMGSPFDPMVHEAIQQLETDEVDPGCIAAEVQAGYRLGERLIRPAMVVVAKPRSRANVDASPEDADGMNGSTTH